jgi:hypothetical protein
MGGSIMAVVINGTTGIDKVQDGSIGTADLAADAVTTAKIADTVNLGRRNLVINGAMNVAQRGTSKSGITGSAYTTVDRLYIQTGTLGTWTHSQATDAPNGFSNSFKVLCTTAAASPSAGGFKLISARLEGQDLQQLAFGTSDAKTITLSFWVKSNKTGTYTTSLQNFDNAKQVGSNYTVNSADTWEKKVLTFNGDTVIGFDNDNGVGLQIDWWLAAGTDWTAAGAPLATWAGYDVDARAGGLTVNLADATNNYWQITGVQLESGDTATPFEHRSFGEELSLCQRYCFQLDGQDYAVIGMKDGQLECFFPFPTTMRALPTVHWSGTLSDYTIRSGGVDYTPTQFSQLGIRDYHYGWVRITNSSVGATGYVSGNADGFVRFDSEL